MKYEEAIKAISIHDHAGQRIRRAGWASGEFLRRATAEEHHLGHSYVRVVAGKKAAAANLTPEDVAADDWSVEAAEGEAKPKTPTHAPPPHEDDDKKTYPRR